MGAKVEQTNNPDVEDTFLVPTVPSSEDFKTDPQVWDVIVVGAGVAGAAFAHQQGKDGRRVLLLERDLAQPDRIIGELLQPGGYLTLKRMGLHQCVDEIDSQKVYGYCMLKDAKAAKIAYPVEGMGDDVAGRSFHNGRFVQRLRQAAAAVPNVTVRRGTVRSLVNDKQQDWEEGQVVTGVRYRTADKEEHIALAHLTVVCDGMYSTFRTKLQQKDAGRIKVNFPSYFVGLLLKDVKLPHPNYGHVILGHPSPVLFYPISSSEVRCLVDYPGEKLPSVTNGDLQRYLLDTVAPQVPAELQAAFKDAITSGRVRSMQNKQLDAAPLRQPGALLLGDAFNMRHPLTGGGMTVALSDANLLCDMLRPLRGFDNPVVTSDATAAFFVRRKPLSATINTLANALYKVFCASKSRAHEEMRQACFNYLALGGMYSAGPISLLGGINPRPSVLVAHFFMVALYGVGRLLLPRPTLKGLWLGILLLYSACCIILPIIWAEGVRAVFFPALASKSKVDGEMRKVASTVSLAAVANGVNGVAVKKQA